MFQKDEIVFPVHAMSVMSFNISHADKASDVWQVTGERLSVSESRRDGNPIPHRWNRDAGLIPCLLFTIANLIANSCKEVSNITPSAFGFYHPADNSF